MPPSPPSTARRGGAATATGDAPSSAPSPPSSSSSAALTLPTVRLPLLAPGRPLPATVADMEAAARVHFRDSSASHGKRSRSAAVPDAAFRTTAATVLDLATAEEATRGAVVGTVEPVANAAARPASPAVSSQYLVQLFSDPTRREQDVYRLVDVAHCRRALAAEEEAFRRAAAARPGTAVAASAAAPAGPKRVCELNSCMTAGQHRRYRVFVLEWLRHQPSRAAPPDSGEVLRVVQQEQRLFLEALRREAVRRAVRLSSGKRVSSYAHLNDALVGFAQQRRVRQMRTRLLTFLDDAKAKTEEGRVLQSVCPGPTESATPLAGRSLPGVGNADAEGLETQLFKRRFPDLRVLQWHLVRNYNAQQGGFAVPFPNPHVRSSSAPSTTAHEGRQTAAGHGARRGEAQQVVASTVATQLSLEALPSYVSGGEDKSDIGSVAASDVDGHEEEEEEEGALSATAGPAFAVHLAPAGVSGGVDTNTSDGPPPLPTAALHEYVALQLFPRLGWQSSRYAGGGTETADITRDTGFTQTVPTASLSITFEALLKLFVAHVDTEEPRTSFRVPLCVRLTPLAQPRPPSSSRPGRGAAYHAHVMVGAPVPNVKESRHSVQVAAGEWLLRHATSAAAAAAGAAGGASTGATARSVAAVVHLTQSLAKRRDTQNPSDATAEDRSRRKASSALKATRDIAGGEHEALRASMAELLRQPSSTEDAAPTLSFHVAAVSTTHSAREADAPPLFVMTKMEHLNHTSAIAAAPPTLPPTPVPLTDAATAATFGWLLEVLSPREMLQLDLLFSCFPTATVLLHRVQLATPAGDTDGGTAPCMQVLAVEPLTAQTWAVHRRQLAERPADSLITTPSPAEVLATHSWDLLYDTLAWALDTVARRAAFAVAAPHDAASAAEDADGAEASDKDEGADSEEGSGAADRYMYFILSNHANLVNTSASSKLYTKKRPESSSLAYAEVAAVTSTYTESRFAVRYVMADATEVYPGHETKADIVVEASNLHFLEEEEESASDVEGDDATANAAERGIDDGAEAKEAGVSAVASRLYRDPHTWIAESIPFTFPRAPPGPTSPPP